MHDEIYTYTYHHACSSYSVTLTVFQEIGLLFSPLEPGWSFVIASANRIQWK